MPFFSGGYGYLAHRIYASECGAPQFGRQKFGGESGEWRRLMGLITM